jgi:hypothetical protein
VDEAYEAVEVVEVVEVMEGARCKVPGASPSA